MDKPITRFERVLLFFRSTSFKMSKDIAPFPNSYYKRGSFLFPAIILFALLDIALGHLKLHTSIAIVAVLVYIVFDWIIYVFYEDKVDFITDNYYSYYSGYLYALCIILQIASVAYMGYLMFNNWSDKLA